MRDTRWGVLETHVAEAEVRLRNGTVVMLRSEGEVVVVSTAQWQQELSREEAWELAEALDAIATAADEDSG